MYFFYFHKKNYLKIILRSSESSKIIKMGVSHNFWFSKFYRLQYDRSSICNFPLSIVCTTIMENCAQFSPYKIQKQNPRFPEICHTFGLVFTWSILWCLLMKKRQSDSYKRLIYECRCDEIRKAKAEWSTSLAYTVHPETVEKNASGIHAKKGKQPKTYPTADSNC